MEGNPWIDLIALAGRQHGVVARCQVRQLGVDDRVFHRRARAERWKRPHRGIYLVPGATWGPMSRLSAALLAAGGVAMATGLTALHLQGVVDTQPGRLHLVVPHEQRARSLHAVEIVRSRTLRAGDSSIFSGLRCARAPRAFVDVAPRVEDDGQLRALLIDARQVGATTPAGVIERAAVMPPRHPGRTRLIDVAEQVAGVGADSLFSDLVHRRLLADGFRPDPQPVSVEVGGRLLHPDITFADARVAIECDSLGFHGDQRSIDLDHRKDQSYASVWWRCLRVGWYRYDHDWPGFTGALRHTLVEWPTALVTLGR